MSLVYLLIAILVIMAMILLCLNVEHWSNMPGT